MPTVLGREAGLPLEPGREPWLDPGRDILVERFEMGEGDQVQVKGVELLPAAG